MKKFSEKNNLKRFRLLRFLSQLDLAEKSHISQSRISLIENDYTKVTRKETEKLAVILGVSALELFP